MLYDRRTVAIRDQPFINFKSKILSLIRLLFLILLLNGYYVQGKHEKNLNDDNDATGYAPRRINCNFSKNVSLVREASSISLNESEWLQQRRKTTVPALYDFLERSISSFKNKKQSDLILKTLFNIQGNDQIDTETSFSPQVGIAISGGGYRSMLTGAGVLAAMDLRTKDSVTHGLGGLLQATSYIAGISGGNWLVGSLAWNNWTSVQSILDNMHVEDSIWDLDDSIISPGGLNIIKTAQRWVHISDAIDAKRNVGFETSLTDVWGRALSYHFFPKLKRGGIDYTWSSLRESEVFKNGEMPFPISVADGRYPGTKVINLNATIFEFNPFEMGSWDPSLNAFTDVKYIGTNMSNGIPVDMDSCIVNYDNTAFVMGTSATLFNQFLLRINSTKMPRFIRRLGTHILKGISQDFNDVAVYHPNPFKDTKFVETNFTTSITESDFLFLVDGGEDDENIPFVPLVQRDRNLDVIFAVDSSADMKIQWPDGSSLVHTYERQFVHQGKQMAFPYVPDTNTFVNLGLNKRPTFFGCDGQNLTSLKYIPPLVVYLPNSEYSFNSNQSAFKLSYTERQRKQMIQNGFEIATRNNFTDDPDFLGCIGCAIIRRKQEAFDLPWPQECEECFINYCWDGTLDTKELPDYMKDVHGSFINENGNEGNNMTAVTESGLVDGRTLLFSDVSYLRKSNSKKIKEGGQVKINLKIIFLLICILTFLMSLI